MANNNGVPFSQQDQFPVWKWANPGWLTGFLFCGLLAFIFAMTELLLAGTFWSAVIPIIYFGLGFHITPTAHRGVLKIFGAKRVRIYGNHDQNGYEEGPNWVPVPRPFTSLKSVNVQRRAFPDPTDTDTPPYLGEEDGVMKVADFTKSDKKGRAPVVMLVMFRFEVFDPYRLQSEQDPYKVMVAIFDRTVRHFIGQYTPDELYELDRAHLSEAIHLMVMATFASSDDSTPVLEQMGIRIRNVEVRDFIWPESLTEAWLRPLIEVAEKSARDIENRGFVTRINRLVKAGAHPDRALAVQVRREEGEGSGVIIEDKRNDWRLSVDGLDRDLTDKFLDSARAVSGGAAAVANAVRRGKGNDGKKPKGDEK